MDIRRQHSNKSYFHFEQNIPTGVIDAPVPQQNASDAPHKSVTSKRLSMTLQPNSLLANSRIDARVTPGRMVPLSRVGVITVKESPSEYTAKKLEAPASSTASPLWMKRRIDGAA